jgi:predicted DNA binding CopG/RHH family protein
MTERRLPDFKTAEEEAAFWETHSVVPYLEQLEDAEFEVVRPRKRQVSIRFDPAILEQVRRVARARGVPYQTLIQLWVAEKLAEVQK